MRARQKESLISLAKEDVVVKNGYTFRFADDSIDDGMEVAVQAVEPDPSSSSSTASSSSSDANDEKLDEICVSWHDTLSSVPTHDAVTDRPVPTFVICQELVDALPIHSFQKIDGGVWRERLVDVAIRDDSEASEAADKVRSAVVRRYANAEVDETNNDTSASSVPSSSNAPDTSTPESMKKIPRLRFVLPPDTTPAIRSLLRVDGRGSPLKDNPAAAALDSLPVGSIIEACPEGLLMVQDIADRIVKCNGGAALIVDYGGDGSSGGDTLRGFWKHTQVHPLSRPGEVDVTADVDFGALREAVNSRMTLEQSISRKMRQERRGKKETSGDAMTKVAVDESSKKIAPALLPQAFGPISQGKFLAQMGIVQRVEKKIEDPETTDEQAFEIYSAMERLIVAEQMGERYKVMAITPKKDGLFPPPGF
jgi:NADH dehydrogenase [ubiquinone] 1 alpha subcomplex assembly factor 7